jgi:hypothetical protein
MGKPGKIKPAPTCVTVVCSQCGERLRKREAIGYKCLARGEKKKLWYCRACLCVDEYPPNLYYAVAMASKSNNSFRDMRTAM